MTSLAVAVRGSSQETRFAWPTTRNGHSPRPAADSEFAVESAEAEYLGLIHAVQEAEDQSERRLAELALAIFLIGLNYELSSTDLANLFTFQPRSQELTNSQHAFESLARDHILSLARRGKLPLPRSFPRRRQATAWQSHPGLAPQSRADAQVVAEPRETVKPYRETERDR